ncbi:MAG: DUF3568 family protein [Phycisphaerae bacterium]|nr:DUF3568 family protein [Phycisphaerae bacterium]
MPRARKPTRPHNTVDLAQFSGPSRRGREARALCVACLAAATMMGCAASREEIALGTGSYAFVSGEFVASADGRPEEFGERARAILEPRASGVRQRARPTWSDVRGTLPDGREVVIRATRAGSDDDRLRVSIRVGPLGDEAESVRLLEAIRARAPRVGGTAAGTPPPDAPAGAPPPR